MYNEKAIDKSVIITGSAKRLGRTMADIIAKSGFEVIIHANHSIEDAQLLQKEIIGFGGAAQLLIGNLEDEVFCKEFIARANEIANHKLYGLINNASTFENDSAADFNDDLFQRHMNLNCLIPLKLSRDFANIMGDKKGCIINILDQRVFKPNPYFFSYNISKMALFNATKTMAQTFAPNVRVNGIAPGPSMKNARQSEEDFEKQYKATLLQSQSTPEDIAQGILYLLNAKSITGQIIAIDSGQNLTWQTPDIVGIIE